MKTLTLLLMALSLTPVHAEVAENVLVENSFARAAIQQQRNSAAFMTIHNTGGDAFISYAKSPAARVVELHSHVNDSGVMRMRKIERIDLPAGQSVLLQPGGLHVMLLGLTRDLKQGESIAVTLGFHDGSEKLLRVPVRMVMMRHGKPAVHPPAGASRPKMMAH